MGVIAFVRQTFSTRSTSRPRSSTTSRTKARGRGRSIDPALDAMQPALAGRMPVAFEAETSREILRALEMAKAFKLDPIITNGREADQVAPDLKAAERARDSEPELSDAIAVDRAGR